MPSQLFKDPGATLDYAVDWTQWLAGDTLTASSWVGPAGITLDSPSRTGTVATIWVSGGTDGDDYVLTNHVTTADGRIDDRSLILHVRER